jgi:hypothetical protein
VIRYCEAAKKFYLRKKAKHNGIVAIKAISHKLARACVHMIKQGESVFCAELLLIRFGHMSWQCCVDQKLWLDNKLSEKIGHTFSEIRNTFFR